MPFIEEERQITAESAELFTQGNAEGKSQIGENRFEFKNAEVESIIIFS